MNIKALIEAMSPEEQQLASSYLYQIRTKQAIEFAKTIELTNEEKAMVKEGKLIEPIKTVKARLGCSLFEAKEAVEMYKGTL